MQQNLLRSNATDFVESGSLRFRQGTLVASPSPVAHLYQSLAWICFLRGDFHAILTRRGLVVMRMKSRTTERLLMYSYKIESAQRRSASN